MKTSTNAQTPRNGSLKKQNMDDYILNLRRACDWLNIEQGRVQTYVRLLEEFNHVSPLSDEHILAYYESCDIVDLFDLWQNEIIRFPGLQAKIQTACKKGPTLTEDEQVSSSSNKPRNDAFGFVLAGKFLSAGISVASVDGINTKPDAEPSTSDFSFCWEDALMSVECKRLQSSTLLLRRAKEARDQITRTGRSGIIAIDCSVLARPSGTLLETNSPQQAVDLMFQWLEEHIVPEVLLSLSSEILGFILFSRIPAMTAMQILNAQGEAYRRRDSLAATLAVGNRHCPNQSVLQHIVRKLRT